ncbi:MAG: hypothetical protein DSZ15_00060 [Candidatus Thioglobus sp.]|nr:MAG: hypothetical protein DSZ15_00060 [Candidatus Thioglobus sp.]
MKLTTLILILLTTVSVQATTDDDAPYSFIYVERNKLIGAIPGNLSNDDIQLTCIGDKIDFLDQPFNVFFDKAWSSDSYWEKIDINGHALKVPEFGLYREVNNLNGKRYWILENSNGWARLDVNSGYFVATMGLIQLQVRCLEKIKDWNNFQK